LKLQAGDILRCGVTDIGVTDTAKIEFIDRIHSTKDHLNRSPHPVDSLLTGVVINLGLISDLQKVPATIPPIDLILAVPRPLRLERLLPVISCMGVARLFLVGAKKVEKDFFGKNNKLFFLVQKCDCLSCCCTSSYSSFKFMFFFNLRSSLCRFSFVPQASRAALSSGRRPEPGELPLPPASGIREERLTQIP
jgi:hypothetical protein